MAINCFCDAQSITFATWQASFAAPVATRSTTDNWDGDLSDDLLEYALGTDPASGLLSAKGALALRAGIVLGSSATVAGVIDASLRPNPQATGITYTLQTSLDLVTWGDLTTPTLVNGIYTWANIDAATLANAGFARLMVTYGTIKTYGQPQGWSKTSFTASSTQSYGLTLLPDVIYAGVISSIGPNTITVRAGETNDLRTAFLPNRAIYLEFADGLNVGERIDLIPASCTANTLSLDLASTNNTLNSLPATVVNSRFVLRHHEILGEVFPASAYLATNNSATADAVYRWDASTSSYKATNWLFNATGSIVPNGPRWVNSIQFIDMAGTVLRPDEAVYFRRKGTTTATLVETGEVRSWAMRRKLVASNNFISNPYPLDQSPISAGFTSANGFLATNTSTTAASLIIPDSNTNALLTSTTSYWLYTGAPTAWVKSADTSLLPQDNLKFLVRSRGYFAAPKATAGASYLAPILGTSNLPINPLVDSDGDGLADTWEMAWFGNLAKGTNDTADDTDSLTLREEYVLGTNPKVEAISSTTSSLGFAIYTPSNQF